MVIEHPAVAADAAEEIRLRDLIADLQRSRYLLLGLVAACALAGAAAGLLIGKKYTAVALVAPVLDDGSSGSLGGLGALASRYGGLASLAGISLDGGGRREEAVAVLESELLTTAYVREKNLLPVLFEKQWDAARSSWRGSDVRKQPSLWKANQFFKKRVRNVAQNAKTGLVTLRITWTDPQLAAQWANDLVSKTNDYLRSKAIAESERNIAYLDEQAAKTDIVEARRAIFEIMQEELNRQMLARGREEYALKVIDPAVAPERPSSAGVVFLTAVGFTVGVFAALFLLLVRRVIVYR